MAAGNGQWHDDLTPVWDAVYLTAPHIIRHVIGEAEDDRLTLTDVVEAFYEAAVATASAVRPDLLTEAFGRYPAGPYASRIQHGAALFTADVAYIWNACIDSARARYAGWPEPVDILTEASGTPVLTDQHVPAALWPTIRDLSERMGVATSSVALAAIVACASVINEDWQVQPKRHDYEWKESARLWGAIVGPPSVLKSPVIAVCTAPVVALNMAGHAAWATAMAAHKVAHTAWKRGDRAGPEPVAPRKARYLVESVTVEALQEVLRDDPDGRQYAPLGKVLARQDELAEFLANMDKYQQNGGSDRGAWLRAYNGGPFVVDRIGRGSFVTKSWSACVLGGIQPQPIQTLAGKLDNDGMIQRFMFDVPMQSVAGLDRAPDYAALAGYRALFPALAALEPARTGDLHRPHDVVSLHRDGHAAREDINTLAMVLAAMPDASLRLQSAFGKWPGLFARLCLTFHLIDVADARARGDIGPPVQVISAATVATVQRYMRGILAPMLLRADALMFSTRMTGHADWIAGYILAHKLDRITARQIAKHYHPLRAPEERRTLDETMESLNRIGWVEPEPPSNPIKPPTGWKVNPRVHLAFKMRAEAERARRAAVKEAIAAHVEGLRRDAHATH